MTSKIIGGEAAARIGRLIGFDGDAATAELEECPFPWKFTISAYASDSSAKVTVDLINSSGRLCAIFVRSFPLLKKQMSQVINDENTILCAEMDWDPDGGPIPVMSKQSEPFITGDAHARIREAYNEFQAALALAAEEREKVK